MRPATNREVIRLALALSAIVLVSAIVCTAVLGLGAFLSSR